MLKKSRLVAFVATTKPEDSKQFYTETLGLKLLEETPFAIVCEAKNTIIRIQKTEKVCPPPYTALGWEVENLTEAVSTLTDLGVQFESYEGLEQDEMGIWSVPGGARVAWFKDPDNNLLSLTQLT